MQTDDDGGEAVEHVMLSYNWDHQTVIKRINTALQSRCYNVWIDIEKMQGSTVEAMSSAVEGAAVMCYGISQAYKESTNCRMEAQYAFQQQKDMVPLMMEDGYRAKGWLGMLLAVRLYYQFCGVVLGAGERGGVRRQGRGVVPRAWRAASRKILGLCWMSLMW